MKTPFLLRRPLASTYLLIIVLVLPIFGQRTRPTLNSQPLQRPRLILLITVDQFRQDYIERFGDLFQSNGIKRLIRDGARWEQAHYDHSPTYTACGHATMMTGAYPAETGIVGNEWIERETSSRVTSVYDNTVKLLGGNPNHAASSPRRLLASSVGDELRLASNGRSKVIGISVKDRSAILPAGRHANGAYWFNSATGNMVSSTYYFPELPQWVAQFNAKRPADKFFGKRWERLLPEGEYLKRAGADAPPWENIGRVLSDTNMFPHTITGGATTPGSVFYSALDYSPFSNDMLVQFAQEALVNEQLGQDEDTDILSVSFSANDYVGHRFGPYSHEVMDITLRTDRQIGTLLDFVNAKVGLRNTIIILTSDHGVAPIPEHATALGLDGARLKTEDILKAVRSAITARYNPKAVSPDPTSDYIFSYKVGNQNIPAYINGNLYLNHAALQRDQVDLEEISRIVGEAAMSVRGISRYFTRSQLQKGSISITDPIERRVLHGFHAARSGDVVIVAAPYKYRSTIPADHGTPYSYDTHVPLIIMAAGLNPGRYFEQASPADIAPTISILLRTTPPTNVTGRVLIEAFRK